MMTVSRFALVGSRGVPARIQRSARASAGKQASATASGTPTSGKLTKSDGKAGGRRGPGCPDIVPRVVPVPASVGGVDVKGLMTLRPPLAGDRASVAKSKALTIARSFGNLQSGNFTEAVLARYTDLGQGQGRVNRLAWIVVQTLFHPEDETVGGPVGPSGQPYRPLCANFFRYHLIVLDAVDGHLLRGYPAR